MSENGFGKTNSTWKSSTTVAEWTAEEQRRALDPFYTTKKVRRVGPWTTHACPGSSKNGRRLHPRISPRFGDKALRSLRDCATSTGSPWAMCQASLSPSSPAIPITHFIYEHDHGTDRFRFDTQEIKNELGDVPINHVDVLKFIREHISNGLKRNPFGSVTSAW